MELKKLKPITNGSRHVVKIQKNLLSKSNRLVKSILFKNVKRNGRSPSNGRISSWHKGGGVKNLYRDLNFYPHTYFTFTNKILEENSENQKIIPFTKNVFQKILLSSRRSLPKIVWNQKKVLFTNEIFKKLIRDQEDFLFTKKMININIKTSTKNNSITNAVFDNLNYELCPNVWPTAKLVIKPRISIIVTTCYNPVGSAFVSLHFDLRKKTFFFNTATESVRPGAYCSDSRSKMYVKTGSRNFLKNIPAGTLINNITLTNNLKAKYIKSAGTYGQVVQNTDKAIRIRLPSKKILTFPASSRATIGVISNKKHYLRTIGNAGTNRRLGIRPTVRGIAMNPVDHPHGGRANGGRPSVSPWGIPTKAGFYLRKKR